jgi:hypothetical protein
MKLWIDRVWGRWKVGSDEEECLSSIKPVPISSKGLHKTNSGMATLNWLSY